ncbi:transmembrane protein 170B-like [Mytilus californianus]|uniref:transmembrane protein 170B-like n=1 Tax=Mytilus californianus TaxID=6549 RepID=UPI0022473EEA|nr:transmembrane protein 170B-like [Mytilus californianus]
MSSGSQDEFTTPFNIFDMLGLTPGESAKSFAEIWYQVFLWALFTSIFVHAIAAILAFIRLRKHKIGRWMSLVIIVMGVLCPLTGGVITSATIAGFYRGSDFEMKPFIALLWGLGQTVVVIVVSFSRILATL